MLIRHSALYISAKLLPGALGMLTTAGLTRLLPPETYGTYGIALIIMSFGTTLGFEWLGLAYLRLAPTAPASAAPTFDRLFCILLAIAILIALAALPLILPPDRPIVAAGFFLMASYAWFEFRARLPVAALAPGLYFRMNLTRAALILLAATATAALTHDPVWTAIATALATLAASLGAGLTPTKGFDRPLAIAAIRFGLPLAASLALSSATNSLTRALVGGLGPGGPAGHGGVEALGLYTAAFVLVQNTLVVLSSGVSAAGFSLAVRALETGDIPRARHQLAANGALLLAILAPAALGMALCADPIAATLVGPRFRDAVATLTPWLAAAAFLGGFRAHYLDHAFQLGRALGGQIGVTATAAIVTLGLDALLIPTGGARGAAIAVTTGAAASFLHAIIAGRTAFPLPLSWRQATRIAAACALMAAAILPIPGTTLLALIAKITAGLLTYAAAALTLDVIGARTALRRRYTRTPA